MEPSAFAAQLIARLEKLKRERDTMSSLEERLQQIQEVRVHVKSDHGAPQPACERQLHGCLGSALPLCPLLLETLNLMIPGTLEAPSNS